MGLDGKETSEPCHIDEDIMTVAAIHDKKIDIEIIREKVQVAFIADKMVESCLWCAQTSLRSNLKEDLLNCEFIDKALLL
jgi:hypothetical protein